LPQESSVDSIERRLDFRTAWIIAAMFSPSPPPNRCQKMVSAVAGWPPVMLVMTGDPQAASIPAKVKPPPAAMN